MNEEAKIIVEDIFSSLEFDNETNLDLLEQKKEKYKDHPRAKNILDKILIKEKEYLDKNNKEAYDGMIKSYVESIEYGVKLAQDYFESKDFDNAKKVLEVLIKTFSSSYINDEFGNCVYFKNELEKELYTNTHIDYRPLFECVVDKGYVYYMYGRILLEFNKVNEALLSFDLAKTYSPFLKEAYFFKALLLKVNKRFMETKESLLEVHKYLYKDIDLADFYYFVGNYCYKFINKEYEYLMYQKSYSLSPNKELYDELVSIKPVDRDLELDMEYFKEVADKENIPVGYDLNLLEQLNKLLEGNKEYKSLLEE